MTRIMIIGSSHVAALKMGWDQIAHGHQDLSLSFYGLPGKTFRKLQIDTDRRFGIHTPELFPASKLPLIRAALGGDMLDLSQADAVISVGWYLHEAEHARLLAAYSVDGHHAQTDRPHLSQPAYEAFADALALHSLPAKPWRHWSRPQFYVLPKPRKSDACLIDPDPAYQIWRDFAQACPVGGAELLNLHVARVSRILGNVGVTLIPLPDQVTGPLGLTPAGFTEGGLRLPGGEPPPEVDHHHMNAEYGAIVIKHVIETIAANQRQKESDYALGS